MFVPPAEDKVIKIGFLNDATGPISVYAEAFTFAANAAADTLSANDGYTFEIVEADSGCSGDLGGTAAQTLVDSGVVGVAGATLWCFNGSKRCIISSWNPTSFLCKY